MISARVRDLSGLVFGRLVVTDEYKTRDGKTYWKCACSCGAEKSVRSDILLSNRTSSCGCLSQERRKYGQRKPDSYLNLLYRITQDRARKRGLTFSLTKSDLRALIVQNCTYCGTAPQVKQLKHKNPDSVFPALGIDRVDNNIGYEPDNCVPCCTVCNMMKKELTKSEFLNHAAQIVRHSLDD